MMGLPMDVITVHRRLAVRHTNVMLSPWAVDDKLPPAPNVVVDAPMRICCSAAWVTVKLVAPSRTMEMTDPTGDTAGNANERTPPGETHIYP